MRRSVSNVKVGDILCINYNSRNWYSEWEESNNAKVRVSVGPVHGTLKVIPFENWKTKDSGYSNTKKELMVTVEQLRLPFSKRRENYSVVVLDKNPTIAASYLGDKHLGKVILNSCKLLSDVIHKISPSSGYLVFGKSNCKNHFFQWSLESFSNSKWLLKYALSAHDEYLMRFEREHKCFQKLKAIEKVVNKMKPWGNPSQPPICMPPKFMSNSVVDSYRYYYFLKKNKVATWRLGAPEWWLQLKEIYEQRSNGNTY